MSYDLDTAWDGVTDIPFVHVYGQHFYHDPATIRGNRLALTGLRDAINKALESGEAEAVAVATDGDHFSIQVQCTEVVSVIGSPEYLYLLEYQMGIRSAERDKRFGLTPTAPKES